MDDRQVRPLVDVPWLLHHLTDRTVVPVEVAADLSAYYEAHVPGAVPLSWLDDLMEPDRRGAPSRRHVEQLLGAHGIRPDHHLVVYGEHENVFAAYAYWLLRYYGHDRVSLLDGGRRAWQAADGPLTDEPTERPPTTYTAAVVDDDVRIGRERLLDTHVGAPGRAALVDCRTEEEFRGCPVTASDLPLLRHRLGGHIPGASNVSAAELVDAGTGRLLPEPELREVFDAQGLGPASDVAVYCDVGGRSALVWFVLHEVLGWPRTRLYDGGWAEYGSLVGAPVDR